FAPPIGGTFTIIRNDLADTVAGTFAGAPEGSFVTVGGVKFKITYAGNDPAFNTGGDANGNNDVILARVGRFDFNASTDPSTVQPTYDPVLPSQLFSPGGAGWLSPEQAYDRGPGAPGGPLGRLYRDGHWGDHTGNTFRIAVNPNTTFQLTA